MDRLTTIETNIATVLKSISKKVIGSYTQKTTTGTVNVYDMALAGSLAVSAGMDGQQIDYTVEQDPSGEVNEEFGIGQNIYTNTVAYLVTAQIRLTGAEVNPRNAAMAKANEVLADLKQAFGTEYSLFRSVNWIKYDGSKREFSDDGDIITGCELRAVFEVNYSQGIINPDSIAS